MIERFIKQYLNKGRNCLIVVSGETGTGKSYSALRIAEKVDPTFDVSRVCFNQLDFIKLLNEKDKRGRFILKKRSAVIFEEGGVSVDSRSWWLNKDLSHIVETFRNRQLIVIFTLPIESMLDKNVRALTNISVFTLAVLRKEKRTRVVVKQILLNKYNRTSDPYIQRYFRDKGKRITSFLLRKPTDKLCRDYERIANKWKHQLLHDITERLENENNKEQEKVIRQDTNELVKIVKKDLNKFKTSKGNLSQELIKDTLNLSQRKAILVKQIVEKDLHKTHTRTSNKNIDNSLGLKSKNRTQNLNKKQYIKSKGGGSCE